MLNRRYGLCIGLGVAILAAGLWLGSFHPAIAQTSVVGGQNVRFMLSAASDAGMFMVDSTTGETWTLVTPDVTPSKQWKKLSRVRE